MVRTSVRNPVLQRLAAVAVVAMGLGVQAQAQTQPPAPATPVPSAPAPATPAVPAPEPAPSVPQAAPAGPMTLAPAPVDPSMPDEVMLASRPALTVRGQSSWDDGYDILTKSFEKLMSEAAKGGLKAAGVPLASFLETDDTGFKFEAQLPLSAAPSGRPAGIAPEIGVGKTLEGKAIRFVHRAPYDDIDSTYEAISAYLDAKGIEVKESFTEEYVNSGKDAGDTALEIFIYVQPK